MTRYHDETRILRGRLAALREAWGRALAGGDDDGAERVALQVYDGGAMPTTPDSVFLGHVVSLDTAEAEGATGGVDVDTSTTVPFIAVGGVPSVGDLVEAVSAGGRWVAQVGRCPPIAIRVACTGRNVSGASVVIKDGGGTTVAGGTTDAGGKFTPSPPLAPGTYEVVVAGGSGVPACTETFDGTLDLRCGEYGVLCCEICGNCDLGTRYPVLHVTDSHGTVACTWRGSFWEGCHAVAVDDRNDPCGCASGAAGTPGDVTVTYQLECNVGNTFRVQRFWSFCAFSVSSYCNNNLDPTTCLGLHTDCGGKAMDCDGGVADSATRTVGSCDPFPFSLDLTLAAVGPLPSPLGPSITINP